MKNYKKALSTFLAVIFTASQIVPPQAGASFWAERKENREDSLQLAMLPTSAPLAFPDPGLGSLRAPQFDELKFPSLTSRPFPEVAKTINAHGHVGEIFVSPVKNAPLVVLIKDVHGQAEAQKNISALISSFKKENNIGLVGVEGAEGPFSLQGFRAYPDSGLRRAAADSLLEKDLIGGAEHAGLTSNSALTLWGVENKHDYEKNIQAIKESRLKREAFMGTVRDFRSSLFSEKTKDYSIALFNLEWRSKAYQSKHLGLASYLDYLLEQAAGFNVQSASVRELSRLRETFRLERTINFEQVQKEKSALLNSLATKADKTALENLYHLSLAYKAGEISYGAYVQVLMTLCRQSAVSLNNFPAVQAYMAYAKKAEGFKPDRVMSDLDDLRNAVVEKLAVTPEQVRLAHLTRLADLAETLAGSEMTPHEWEAYAVLKKEMGVSFPGAKPFEDFYAYALKRDANLVSNLLAQMTETKETKAVLLAGGFHASGAAEHLKNKNISYVTVSPKMDIADASSSYTDSFIKNPVPLEILFRGEAVNLISPRPLADSGSDDDHHTTSGLFHSLYSSMLMAGGGVLGSIDELAGQLLGVRSVTTSVIETGSALVQKIRISFKWDNGLESTLDAVASEASAVSLAEKEAGKSAEKISLSANINGSVKNLVVFIVNSPIRWASQVKTFSAYLAQGFKALVPGFLAQPAVSPLMTALHEGTLRSLVYLTEVFASDPLHPIRVKLAQTEDLSNYSEAMRLMLEELVIPKRTIPELINEDLKTEEALELLQETLEPLTKGNLQIQFFDETPLVRGEENYLLSSLYRGKDDYYTLFVGIGFFRAVLRSDNFIELLEGLGLREKMLMEGLRAVPPVGRLASYDAVHEKVSTGGELEIEDQRLIEALNLFAENFAKEKFRLGFSAVKLNDRETFKNSDKEASSKELNREAALWLEVEDAHQNTLETLTDLERDKAQLYALLDDIQLARPDNIILFGDGLDASAQAALEFIAPLGRWNAEAEAQGRPRIYFSESPDSIEKEKLAKRLNYRTLWINVSEQFPSKDGRPVIPARLQSVFTAMIYDAKLGDEILGGMEDAMARHRELKGHFQIYPPYKWAVNSVRVGSLGNNVHVFNLWSTKLKLFSVWVAQRVNQALGVSTREGDYIWTGEHAPSFNHSTSQGHRQSKSKNEFLESKGFIYLIYVYPLLQGMVNVGLEAQRYYRGLTYSFVRQVLYRALGLTMGEQGAGRKIFHAEAPFRNAYEFGARQFEFEAMAEMMGRLSGDHQTRNPGSELEISAAALKQPSRLKPVKEGQLSISQNILTFSKGEKVKAGGVIGEKIEFELGQNKENSKTLQDVLSIYKKVANKLKGSVLNKFRDGSALDHLSPERIEEEIPASKAAADRFKSKKKILALQIGGSTTGPILNTTLGMADAPNTPEIIEIQGIDEQQMAEAVRAILAEENPADIGIIVISKSGVTAETDINAWTAIGALSDAFEAKGFSRSLVKENTLLVTDPQLGTLRAKAEREGWLTLDHSVLIGGRWTMFTSVGLLYYFLKGGTEGEALAAVESVKSWEDDLVAALEEIGSAETESLLKSADPEDNLRGMRVVYRNLQMVPGMEAGLLDNIVNVVLNKDTEVAFSWDPTFEDLVSHKNPFYPQLRVESKSKPGVRFYALASYGWSSLKRMWDRVRSSQHTYVTLYAESNGNQESEARLAKVQERLNENKVPSMVIRTGKMTIKTLLQFQMMQYRRLAADAALYGPFEVDSEGQTGVEDAKGKAAAHFAKAKLFIDSIENPDERVEARGAGIPVPRIAPEEVETINELPMDIEKTFTFGPVLNKLVTDVIKGDKSTPGLLSLAFKEEVDRTVNTKVRGLIAKRIEKIAYQNSQQVYSVVMDGEESIVSGDSDIVIRATPLESEHNIDTKTSNGTNIGFYRFDKTGEALTLLGSISILWASEPVALITDGTKTQDFELKYDGRLIERDRPGDDNNLVLAAKGKFVSLNGVSQNWPQGFQQYMREIERDIATKRRTSDALSADLSLMLNKFGRLTTWTTKAEAWEKQMMVEAARGRVAMMSADGMVSPEIYAPLTYESLKDQDRHFIYLGVSERVRLAEVYLNYLRIFIETEQSSHSPILIELLDLLDGLDPSELSFEAKKQIVFWLVKMREAFTSVPSKALSREDLKATAKKFNNRSADLLRRYDREAIILTLKRMYSQEGRPEIETGEFDLLGDKTALMRFGNDVKTDAPMKEIYALEARFAAKSPFQILLNLKAQLEGEGVEEANDLGSLLEKLRDNYKQNDVVLSVEKFEEERFYPADKKPAEFSENLGRYMLDSVGLNDEIRDHLQLKNNHYPESMREVFLSAVDIYLNDQDLSEIWDTDEKILEMREKERSIFNHEKKSVMALHNIRQNLIDNKYEPNVNDSGDVSSRLDDIYNAIFIALLKSKVDEIISEEEEVIVKGRRSKGLSVKQGGASYLLLLDPIDGSSQIPEKGTFGSIFGLAVRYPGQKTDEIDFNTQMAGSMEFQFGWPRTSLTFVNHFNPQTRKPEVVQFERTLDKKGKTYEFRKTEILEPVTRFERDVEWDGLLVKADPDRYLGLAMGGSIPESLPYGGHAEVVSLLVDRYGFSEAYTGALVNDISKLVRERPGALGILHTYGATRSKKSGRYRLSFENYHLAHLFRILDGAVIDGKQYMVDRRLEGPAPWAIETEFYAGSQWVLKFILAWRSYVGEGTVLNDEILSFYDQYAEKTQELLDDLGVIAQADDIVIPKADLRDLVLKLKINLFDYWDEPGMGAGQIYHDHLRPFLLDDQADTGEGHSESLFGSADWFQVLRHEFDFGVLKPYLDKTVDSALGSFRSLMRALGFELNPINGIQELEPIRAAVVEAGLEDLFPLDNIHVLSSAGGPRSSGDDAFLALAYPENDQPAIIMHENTLKAWQGKNTDTFDYASLAVLMAVYHEAGHELGYTHDELKGFGLSLEYLDSQAAGSEQETVKKAIKRNALRMFAGPGTVRVETGLTDTGLYSDPVFEGILGEEGFFTNEALKVIIQTRLLNDLRQLSDERAAFLKRLRADQAALLLEPHLSRIELQDSLDRKGLLAEKIRESIQTLLRAHIPSGEPVEAADRETIMSSLGELHQFGGSLFMGWDGIRGPAGVQDPVTVGSYQSYDFAVLSQILLLGADKDDDLIGLASVYKQARNNYSRHGKTFQVADSVLKSKSPIVLEISPALAGMTESGVEDLNPTEISSLRLIYHLSERLSSMDPEEAPEVFFLVTGDNGTETLSVGQVHTALLDLLNNAKILPERSEDGPVTNLHGLAGAVVLRGRDINGFSINGQNGPAFYAEAVLSHLDRVYGLRADRTHIFALSIAGSWQFGDVQSLVSLFQVLAFDTVHLLDLGDRLERLQITAIQA